MPGQIAIFEKNSKKSLAHRKAKIVIYDFKYILICDKK